MIQNSLSVSRFRLSEKHRNSGSKRISCSSCFFRLIWDFSPLLPPSLIWECDERFCGETGSRCGNFSTSTLFTCWHVWKHAWHVLACRPSFLPPDTAPSCSTFPSSLTLYSSFETKCCFIYEDMKKKPVLPRPATHAAAYGPLWGVQVSINSGAGHNLCHFCCLTW